MIDDSYIVDFYVDDAEAEWNALDDWYAANGQDQKVGGDRFPLWRWRIRTTAGRTVAVSNEAFFSWTAAEQRAMSIFKGEISVVIPDGV